VATSDTSSSHHHRHKDVDENVYAHVNNAEDDEDCKDGMVVKSVIPSVVVTSQGPVSAELIDSWDLDVLAYSAVELSEVSGV
jgi:hypothetical protein